MKNWYGSLQTSNPQYHTTITSGSHTRVNTTTPINLKGFWNHSVFKEIGNPITLVESNNGTYIFYSIEGSDRKALLGIVYED